MESPSLEVFKEGLEVALGDTVVFGPSSDLTIPEVFSSRAGSGILRGCQPGVCPQRPWSAPESRPTEDPKSRGNRCDSADQ